MLGIPWTVRGTARAHDKRLARGNKRPQSAAAVAGGSLRPISAHARRNYDDLLRVSMIASRRRAVELGERTNSGHSTAAPICTKQKPWLD
jgi:hypothetical protein